MSDARSCEPIALTAVALQTNQAIKKLLDDNFSPSASPVGTARHPRSTGAADRGGCGRRESDYAAALEAQTDSIKMG